MSIHHASYPSSSEEWMQVARAGRVRAQGVGDKFDITVVAFSLSLSTLPVRVICWG
jgi:hypothetical protein